MDVKNTSDIEEFLQNIALYQSDIRKKQIEIDILREKIKNCKKKLFKKCKHIWEYDSYCGPYEPIRYKCKKCKLWRDPYLYR